MDQSTIMQNPGPVLETTHVFALIGSLLFFLGTFVFVAPAALQKMFPQYVSFPAGRRVVMENAFVSAVHGIMLAPIGWYCLLYTDLPPRVLFFDHPLVRLGGALEAGYEFQALLCTVMIPALRDPPMVFHHFVVGSINIVGMMYKCTPHGHNLGFITLSSNVFLGIRIILNCVGKGSSKLAAWNSAVFAGMFLYVRIWLLGVEWWHQYHIMLLPEYSNIPLPVFLVDVPCCLMFTVLNVFWFYKICHTAWKMMTKKGKRE